MNSEDQELVRITYLDSLEKCTECRHPMERNGDYLECMNCESKVYRPFSSEEMSATRPKYSSPELKKRVAKKYAPSVLEWLGSDIPLSKVEKDLCENWSYMDDAYEVAGRLKMHCGYFPDARLVEILDNISGYWDLSEMEAEWVKLHNIKPDQSIGHKVGHKCIQHGTIVGEITKINEDTAKYTVTHEELGHTKGSGFVINYEDAIFPW